MKWQEHLKTCFKKGINAYEQELFPISNYTCSSGKMHSKYREGHSVSSDCDNEFSTMHNMVRETTFISEDRKTLTPLDFIRHVL